jgi:hypothetical protein
MECLLGTAGNKKPGNKADAHNNQEGVFQFHDLPG